MIGNAAADARLERDGAPSGAGLREDLRAVLGQQCLVGRHDMLAGRQAVEDDTQGRVDPAHCLHHDLDFRIVDQPGGVGSDANTVELDVPGLRGITDDRPLPANPLTRPAGDAVGMLGQDPGDARSHGAQPDQSNGDVFHVLRRTHSRLRG